MNIRAQIFGRPQSSEPILKSKQPKGVRADELHSIPVARTEGRRGDMRQQDRHRLSEESALLTHGDTTTEVDLINVSGGGAMVSAPSDPVLHDKVQLQLGPEGTIECVVLWIRDGRIGLEFAHETRLDCSDDEQAAVLREVITRSFPELPFAAPAEESAASDHRRAPRHPLIWSGVLHHEFESTTVRVRNISSTGAMIETKVPVRVDSEPTLELSPSAFTPCTVAWAVGDQVGLRFDVPFDMSLLATSRPAVQASASDTHWHHSSLSELKSELEGFLKR
jgi:PilZ domain-containing protein